MIYLAVSVFCFLIFLLFESFSRALARLSAVKLRGLLEEDPRRLTLLSGREGPTVIATAAGVLVQILLLAGLWTLIRGLQQIGVPAAWVVGGVLFLLGWLLVEGVILRIISGVSPEILLRRLARPLAAMSWILLPLAWPVRLLYRGEPRDEGPASEEEIQAYIEVGREEGILEKGEEKLLLSIVDFGDTMVKEVMTPRTDIVAVGEDSTLAKAADIFTESKYSRLPVYRHSADTITGILHIKDLFEAMRRDPPLPLASIMRPVHFVPETKKIAGLMPDLQRRHLSIAVAVDEYGSVSGLVTMEDLLEEIVGEIEDEHEDERGAVVELPGGAYSLSGRTHVDVLTELFGRGPREDTFDTVAGFLTTKLGRIPRAGERYEEDSLLFIVEEADRRRVLRVRVEPLPVAAGAGRPG